MKIDDEIKGRFRNDYHRGLINLIYTVNQLNYRFLQFLKNHKLTEPQYNVLRVLRGFQSNGPVSIGFLKDRMLDKSSDVSRIVDKLYEKGLINRKENVKDRRQKDVEITEKGLATISKMIDCESKADTLLQNLTLEEVQELNRLLDKVRDSELPCQIL
jgi:MarR family transcriptional regulator, multiple gene regulator MgrA